MVVVAEILEAKVGEGETVLVLGPEVEVERSLVNVYGVAEEAPRVVAGVGEVLVGGLESVPWQPSSPERGWREISCDELAGGRTVVGVWVVVSESGYQEFKGTLVYGCGGKSLIVTMGWSTAQGFLYLPLNSTEFSMGATSIQLLVDNSR